MVSLVCVHVMHKMQEKGEGEMTHDQVSQLWFSKAAVTIILKQFSHSLFDTNISCARFTRRISKAKL